jgi:hypothetical protein
MVEESGQQFGDWGKLEHTAKIVGDFLAMLTIERIKRAFWAILTNRVHLHDESRARTIISLCCLQLPTSPACDALMMEIMNHVNLSKVEPDITCCTCMLAWGR